MLGIPRYRNASLGNMCFFQTIYLTEDSQPHCTALHCTAEGGATYNISPENSPENSPIFHSPFTTNKCLVPSVSSWCQCSDSCAPRLAGPSQQHTDTMVELRESLWRIPMAFHNMVNEVEEENINKACTCKSLS